jgi:hypothetical protein
VNDFCGEKIFEAWRRADFVRPFDAGTESWRRHAKCLTDFQIRSEIILQIARLPAFPEMWWRDLI